MKKIYIYADWICSKRSLDANKVYKYFSKNNNLLVDKPINADIIITFTCATSKDMANRSFKKIIEFQKYDAELIVAGCLPAIETKKLSEHFNGRIIITKNLDQLDLLFPENKIKFKDIPDENTFFPNYDSYSVIGVLKKCAGKIKHINNIYFKIKKHILKNLFDEKSLIYAELMGKTHYYVRISWGCLGNCSYCAIRKAIGSHVSKPLDQCIKEFKKGLEKGYKDIVIAGDDVGAYGLDIGTNITKLLDEITKIPGDYNITVQTLHPQWVIRYINELEQILKRQKITHLAILIQSANKRILNLMNRYSDAEKMRDTFLRLKNFYPNLMIHTHCLLGFPSETKEEFKETLDFIAEVGFVGFIFLFSLRPGTKANDIEPKISENEMIKRLKYAKRFLTKKGYNVICFPKIHFFIFDKKILPR